jgi:hypothetical protein
LIEHLIKLSPSTGSDPGAVRREGRDSAPAELRVKHIVKQVESAVVEELDQP